jgi:hypothetical protein
MEVGIQFSAGSRIQAQEFKLENSGPRIQARAKDPRINVTADQHSFSSSIKCSVQADVGDADIQTVL